MLESACFPCVLLSRRVASVVSSLPASKELTKLQQELSISQSISSQKCLPAVELAELVEKISENSSSSLVASVVLSVLEKLP